MSATKKPVATHRAPGASNIAQRYKIKFSRTAEEQTNHIWNCNAPCVRKNPADEYLLM